MRYGCYKVDKTNIKIGLVTSIMCQKEKIIVTAKPSGTPRRLHKDENNISAVFSDLSGFFLFHAVFNSPGAMSSVGHEI